MALDHSLVEGPGERRERLRASEDAQRRAVGVAAPAVAGR